MSLASPATTPQFQATARGQGNECPVCGGREAAAFLALEAMPVLIGQQFASADEARACGRGPIRLAFCPRCSFVWNTAFDAGRLTYAQYDNSLHYSTVFQDYTRQLVARLIDTYGVRGKTVIDIGCGRGDFLEMLCAAGGNRGIGFDPSYEGDPAPDGRPLTFVRDLYSEAYGGAGGDLICSRYVLEHIARPAAFLRMIRTAIGARTGTPVYCEVPNVEFILRGLSVWDIIYEHCSYFSAASLARVFYDNGFRVRRLAEGYDGQFLCVDAVAEERRADRPPRRRELASIAGQVETFRIEFERRIADWRARLAAWRGQGRRVAAWGAGAKAVGFLNMLGAGGEVAGVVDINPRKHGSFLAGTGHRVLAPEELRALRPETIVVLNPIYRREIRAILDGMNLNPELTEA